PSTMSAEMYADQADKEAQKNDYQKAIADYTEAIRLKPDAPGFYNSRGEVYWSLKQYDNAASDLTRAIQIKPTPEAYYVRGLIYVALRQYDKAVSDLTDAIRIKPDAAL